MGREELSLDELSQTGEWLHSRKRRLIQVLCHWQKLVTRVGSFQLEDLLTSQLPEDHKVLRKINYSS